MNLHNINFYYKIENKFKNILINIKEKLFENEDITILNEFNDYKFRSTLKVKKEIEIINFNLSIINNFEKDDKILLNGYQSWSETREYDIYEKQKDFPFLLKPIIEKVYKLQYLGDHTIYKYSNKKGVLHSYSWTYIKNKKDYKFIGSLNENSGFTIFEHNTQKNLIKIIKDCLHRKVKDNYELINLILLKGDENFIFNEYFKELKIKLKTNSVGTGWTSWYNYYTNISEDIILQNLKTFEKYKIPIDYFQIDDGYQNATGDWLIVNNKFPSGMKFLSKEIKNRGYKSGLWLAPFVCSVHSKLFKSYKDFLIKDKNGNPLSAGYNDVWNGDFYILDFYNSKVIDYLKEVFNTVLNDWDFDMVKLDFLYAVALYPREDKTRGEIMYDAINFLNSIIGNKKILGCGVYLNSVFGKVDYCRIGCDVGLKWENKKLKFINYNERISTISAIKDSIFRRFLNFKAFVSDPDVFLLRNENISLTKEQKYTLFLLNLIFGGLVFTSDNLINYDKETLFLYKSHFPFKKKENIELKYENGIYRIYFKIDYVQYTVYANLTNYSHTILIEKDLFLNNNIIKKGSNIKINAYQSVCFVNITEEDFQIIGSTGSVFGGSEVDFFEVSNNNITIKINEKKLNPTTIFIKIPFELNGYKINGVFIKAEKNSKYKIIKLNF